jgi:tRNA U34 2-thiouridine synthase MnmA/TrmU
MRYAIDKKPLKYTSIEVKDEEVVEYNKKYGTTLTGQSSVQYRYSPDEYKEGTDNKGNKLVNCDWREILYQMAVDYYKYNFLDNFELKVIAANKELYPQGKTGYEAYYTDI